MTTVKETVLRAELQAHFWEEYKEYIACTSMTPYERRLLRKWVSECHSVYHGPGSKYLGLSSIPLPFLDVYRMDREIDLETKGMTRDEKTAYLKKITGWEDPSPHEFALMEARKVTPEIIIDYVRDLQRELFYLWCFVSSKGLTTDARAYVDENTDHEVLGEW